MKRIALRVARRRACLTQAELARVLRKPQSFISKLETGVLQDVTRRDAIALGRVLRVDPLALRFG